MFDTERFIIEVQNRVCLWDSREKQDRTAKKRAWEEIAKLFYDNWDNEIETKQRELVDDLQKKWKHLRDYYVKEKKLENTRSGSAAPKKRKNSYVELLRFLNVVKESRVSSGNISAPVGDNDQNENSCDELSVNTNAQPSNANSQQTIIENLSPPQTDEVAGTSQIRRKPKMTVFQQSLITAMNKNRQSTKEVEDADTKFLLSLLPQIKSLNERQNCEFRIEVMNLIYKIKYRNPFNISHNETYSYNHPGYNSYEQSPTTYTADGSPPEYQTYTTNTNSTSSYSTIQSPETQVRPIQSAETETAHSIEEIEEIFQNRSTQLRK